ncbi:hypothetical protein [Sphingomonas koreensis]|uniref:hypothetical protein n=1 Tax=Sphingomonas koreensis TaxID=93064 RepID=UPI001F495072|nr:hypothetical protein [Sphingomonas koreensis]
MKRPIAHDDTDSSSVRHQSRVEERYRPLGNRIDLTARVIASAIFKQALFRRAVQRGPQLRNEIHAPHLHGSHRTYPALFRLESQSPRYGAFSIRLMLRPMRTRYWSTCPTRPYGQPKRAVFDADR